VCGELRISSGPIIALPSYLTANPGKFLDLQGIARPLSDLKNQCGISVSPGQLAMLFDEVT